MELIEQLGAEVERAWRAADYDEPAFPAIARDALAGTPLAGRVTIDALIDATCELAPLPPQGELEPQFGEPAITLFAAPRFYIEALFWLDGTTAIHQHAFSGAFHVLAGSSIHTRWRFRERRRVNAQFRIGACGFAGSELLEAGATREIHPGDGFIHSLFHLDRPSVTIVVRTFHAAGFDPQLSYHPPGVALDPFHREPRRTAQLQVIDHLLRTDRERGLALAEQLVATSDFATAYSVVERQFAATPNDRAGLGRLLAMLEATHGEPLGPVFEERRRQQFLIARRATVWSPDHRFFLALLLNVPRRDLVLAMVAQRAPGRDPIDTVLGWVEELSAIGLAGDLAPNPLGFEVDDAERAVLEALLRGARGEAVVAALAERYDDATAQRDTILALAAALTQAVLFRPLFTE
jgi:hypothetical protein